MTLGSASRARVGRVVAGVALCAATMSASCTGSEEAKAPPPAATQAAKPAPVASPPAVVPQPEGTMEQGVFEIAPEGEIVVFMDALVTEGVAPLTVEFEVEVEGGKPPIEWTWTYGDGETSAEQGVKHQHTFAEPGRYVIQLEVKDADGVTDFDLAEVIVKAE